MRKAALLVALVLGCGEPPQEAREPVVSAEPAETVAPSSAPLPSASAPKPSPFDAAVAPFEPKRVTLVQGAMGTKIQIQTFTTPELDEDAIKAKVWKAFEEIKRIEGLMTTWRDDSEISKVNQGAGGEPVKVGPETLAVIDKSLWMSRESGGVFDISFEAMHGLWKFDQDLDPSIPKRSDIERARKLIDYRKIVVDEGASTVRLADPKMKISLGGIAKGYAVDAASKVLDREGVHAFYVQAGGDLFVRGRKPDGSRFRVGVRDPRGRDENDYFAFIEVEDHAFSTAGDYERSFVKDGKRYHHIIDPRTGYPATASRSVTLWADDAFTADAVDDAVFILGPKKGLELVEKLDGVGAIVVDAKNKVWISKRLEKVLHQIREPTDGI
jgi:thiamine biosynthesis lipoprotein